MRLPDRKSGAVRAACAAERPNRTSTMPPMDTDRIPTQPTPDQEPPDATLTSGPSQALTSSAAGRGSRWAAIGAVVVFALVVTFTAGIVGRLRRLLAPWERRPRTLLPP